MAFDWRICVAIYVKFTVKWQNYIICYIFKENLLIFLDFDFFASWQKYHIFIPINLKVEYQNSFIEQTLNSCRKQ